MDLEFLERPMDLDFLERPKDLDVRDCLGREISLVPTWSPLA